MLVVVSQIRRQLLLSLTFAGACVGKGTTRTVPSGDRTTTAAAESLFARGRLREARAGLVPGHIDASTASAALDAATLALWANDLREAERGAEALTTVDSTNRAALSILAEIRRREDRYADAAAVFRRLGSDGTARMLAALPEPYRISASPAGTELVSAPGTALPVFELEVNGKPAIFLLDTGAGETIIDPSLAQAAGARRFGSDTGSAYAGGRRSAFEHGSIDSLRLGDILIRNLPVQIQSTKAYSFLGGGRPVLGVLGVGVLSHFRSTISFLERPTLQLVPRTTPATRGTAAVASVPFWLLSDHFITVEGTALDSVPALLIIDTGLALPGGAFVPAPLFLAQAGVQVAGVTMQGVGGGGRVTATPFVFPRIDLGGLRRDSLVAVAGVFPPSLESYRGAHVSGLLSHGFFTGRRMTIDFQEMRIIVE